jgi:hypothetical protein
MAKLTIGFGVVLVLLGAWGFLGTGSQHPTALIPAYFGLALAVSGALALTEDAKRRMLVMHIAVTVGLLGFIGSAARAVMELVKAHGEPLGDTAAVAVRFQVAMAVICLVYVGLCVRSFIAARRGRKLDAGSEA